MSGAANALLALTIFIASIFAVPAPEALADPVDAAISTPDKSQYDLFDPTPADQMRSFCTDRPTKSNLPCTVDAGHFQYESDLFNGTYASANGVVRNTYLYTNPTFKLGLTNRMDLELNIAPLEEVTIHDKITHTYTDLTGVGDLYARMKYNVFGNDSGNVAVTLLPYVKIPTAEPGIGNKAAEGGLIVPVSFALPKDALLVIDPEIDDFQNSADAGYHTNFQGLINLSHAIIPDVTGAVEVWSDVNEDPTGTTTQLSLDFAVSWAIRQNLQLDAGTNIGLNNATPDFQGYFGISQRF